MTRLSPLVTRTYSLCPYATLFRSWRAGGMPVYHLDLEGGAEARGHDQDRVAVDRIVDPLLQPHRVHARPAELIGAQREARAARPQGRGQAPAPDQRVARIERLASGEGEAERRHDAQPPPAQAMPHRQDGQ